LGSGFVFFGWVIAPAVPIPSEVGGSSNILSLSVRMTDTKKPLLSGFVVDDVIARSC
jgi:hypothetical protein